MKSDIEIAQQAQLLPITEVAKAAGIDSDNLELYGRYKAKLSPECIKNKPRKGKLILVTAINPTPAGEGKTTVSVGLTDAMRLVGKNVIVVANLKAARIRGVVSHGMVLAASAGDDLKLVTVDMPVGSVVR